MNHYISLSQAVLVQIYKQECKWHTIKSSSEILQSIFGGGGLYLLLSTKPLDLSLMDLGIQRVKFSFFMHYNFPILED